jgi:hypothetical protein
MAGACFVAWIAANLTPCRSRIQTVGSTGNWAKESKAASVRPFSLFFAKEQSSEAEQPSIRTFAPHADLPREDFAAGPLPDSTEPTDVMSLNRTIESLKRENAWLKQQLERSLRSK